MILQSKQSNIIEDFAKYSQDLMANSPEWLAKIQQQGIDRFKELGIPTVKDEEWKYTNLSPVTEKKFHLLTEKDLHNKDQLRHYLDSSEINIVFINGHFSSELSNLNNIPKGMTITGLKEALKDNPLAADLFQRYNTGEEDSFVLLNKALMNDGVFIHVEPKSICKEVVHIVHVTDTKTDQGACFPRSLITLGASSEATILESHIGFSETIYFNSTLTDIFLDQDAKLTYSKVQDEGKASYHIGITRIWQERDSQLESFSMMTGAKLTRNNLNIILNGEGITSTLNGLYVIADDQHVDNHSAVDHRFPNCQSNQLYKGILNDQSRAVFNGKIFVKDIAQQTNSYQLNKNLLLGKDCRVDTKPQLEIFADDVRCTHGATIGQLNEDEIFYLQTRGISKEESIKMLARGFVDDIVDMVPNDSMRSKVRQLLLPTFVGE